MNVPVRVVPLTACFSLVVALRLCSGRWKLRGRQKPSPPQKRRGVAGDDGPAPEASEGDVQGTRRHDEREWWKNRRRRRAISASRLRVASSHVVALLLSCQETKGTAHTSRRLTDDRIGDWQHGKDKNPTPRTRSRGGDGSKINDHREGKRGKKPFSERLERQFYPALAC